VLYLCRNRIQSHCHCSTERSLFATSTCLMAYLHSFCSLPYESSITSSKASSPLSGICCFLLQFPLFSFFLIYSSYSNLLPRLLVTSYLPSIFPSITCFIRQFLLKRQHSFHIKIKKSTSKMVNKRPTQCTQITIY
jgi:hypothetical protein